jgi:hypothetical protein
MKLYVDDDSVAELLIKLLRKAGHDVQIPGAHDLVGKPDAVHLAHAISEQRILLTRNHEDFEDLHELVIVAGGHHPGIFVVRSDNNPARDLSSRGIVTAIGKLLASGITVEDELHVLNHWR